MNFDASNVNGQTVLPNHGRAKVSVALSAIQSAGSHYYIISADGKIVKSGSFDKSRFNLVQSLHISSLQKGMYIIKLSDGTKQQSRKLFGE